ncbi:MAG: magnesium transporter [Candidatus Latescibacteria bacterium]|jgi:magnesium transporter|nr:magnesium transporter [Candidatus Latescibacterota bacterium]
MSTSPATNEDILEEGDLQKRRSELLDASNELLEEEDLSTLRLILNNQHGSDLAEMLSNISSDDKLRVFQLLAYPIAADVIIEIDASSRLTIIENLGDHMIARLVEQMEPDDAADVLGDLDKDQLDSVMDLLAEDTTEHVGELLPHEEDTGGGIMTSRLVELKASMTVADAITYLQSWASEDEVFYLYVIDDEQHLIGTVPLLRLLLADHATSIGTLTDSDPLTVPTGMDQEEVAQIFADFHLMALPVVDTDGKLAGQITIDDIVDVIQDEATEDIYEMAAMSSDELEERSVFGVVRRRLPWLLVCLIGTLLSGGVIDYFATPLGRLVTTLMLFVPAIMAMGGNSGIQTSTVTVRNMAVGNLQPGTIAMVVLRELRIASTMGVLLGFLVYLVARVWTDDPIIAVCVGAAMCMAIILSAALGALIPLFFNKVGIDPAVASGPLITTLNDGLSLILYFSISILLLTYMKPIAM